MRTTGSSRRPEPRRRLPHAALLLLAALLSGVTAFLTWPTRHLITCESLPELGALALCAAVLFVLCMRATAAALAASRRSKAPDSRDRTQDARIPGGAAILAVLALFLAAHYIAVYRAPCAAVQKQIHSR